MDRLDILTKCYTEPHRRYHTLEHIAHMFSTAREFGIVLTEAQKLAIWWHDAVYEPGSVLNENQSIALMMKTEKLTDDKLLLTAVDIIWDTKHEKPPKNEESAIVCDLDMYGFADVFDRTYRMQQQVYAEFSHIPRDEFRKGRLEFLNKLKDTPIFYSEVFKNYRGKAIHAIDKEIKDIIFLQGVGQ